jgi:hypothetical protein
MDVAATRADREPELCGTCGGYGLVCSCGDADCVVSWYDRDHIPDPCNDCDGVNAHRLQAWLQADGTREPAGAESAAGGWLSPPTPGDPWAVSPEPDVAPDPEADLEPG